MMELTHNVEHLFADDDVQAALSVGILLAGLILLFIAKDLTRFDRYGREALAAGGVFMVVTGIFRMLGFYDVISGPMAKAVIGIVGWAIVLIVCQAMWLGYKNHERLKNGS